MVSRMTALCFESSDPAGLARFWEGLLGWTAGPDSTLSPSDDTGFRLCFLPSSEPKNGPNQMHFDLTSTSSEDQQQTVARALGLGARHIDIGQTPEEGHVVLADPEGNEFCVIGPDNTFLADCGFVGALAGDGTQQVGYFWAEALGWPLVWDQDEETAIRSPHGGPKVTWGGPPVLSKRGRNRLHFELSTTPDDLESEVARLISLGAQRTSKTPDTDGWELLDPDGNEFCLRSAPDQSGLVSRG